MSSAQKPTGAAPETEADDKPQPDRDRRGMPAWTSLLAALPILYLFSVGPVVLIADKARLPAASLHKFYAPLIWLHDHTFLEKPLEWYLRLWGVN